MGLEWHEYYELVKCIKGLRDDIKMIKTQIASLEKKIDDIEKKE